MSDASESAEQRVVKVAQVCHEANRAYCLTIGDTSQEPWEIAPMWQRESAIKGVKLHLENPEATPASSHESWLEEKRRTGWQYGAVKDTAKKRHPCFVPYDKLPLEQQRKDALFKAIVDALR